MTKLYHFHNTVLMRYTTFSYSFTVSGNFDRMVSHILSELSSEYDFKYYVVLSYFPKNIYPDHITIVPEGIESVYPKFAINYRNNWMLTHSDYVVTYVVNNIGSGAAKYKEKAIILNKHVIEIRIV